MLLIAFTTSRKVLEAKHTVFNYVVCSNEYEFSFAKFLDKASDIKAFAKLPEQFGFCIQYTDTLANIRNYFPDFVIVLKNGSHWIIETKGREDVEVRLKDSAAIHWCNIASELTGTTWRYLKVLQKEFEALHPDDFEELIAATHPSAALSNDFNQNAANMKEFIVALVSASMQAIDLWFSFRDRSRAKQALQQVQNIQTLPETRDEALNLLIIPDDLLDTFSERVKRCFEKYKEILDDEKYLPGEIDDATEAMKRCVCRELRRLHSVNGSVPDGSLKQWWDQYRCEIEN